MSNLQMDDIDKTYNRLRRTDYITMVREVFSKIPDPDIWEYDLDNHVFYPKKEYYHLLEEHGWTIEECKKEVLRLNGRYRPNI